MSLYKNLSDDDRQFIIDYVGDMMGGICDFPDDIINGLKNNNNWKDFFAYLEQIDILDNEAPEYRALKIIFVDID